ncbi:hypothetical protein [Burkholderia sp. IMCC1007]|uniref:hypothetical protein n=1 Tax=Burkholderia sp. IMCC1007 TaxID=3004104 RepID=UPI0022B4B091|nr:hypothetical protein [Burkholderia sp. IMCC1007]
MTGPPTARIRVEFCAADGYVLRGAYFPAEAGVRSPVLVCPATGLRQSFYFAFAEWLRDGGYPTFVFDYRGIGASLNGCHVRRSRDAGQYRRLAALVAEREP